MNAQEYQRHKAAYFDLLDLEGDARAARLAQIAVTDAALATDLRAKIDAAERSIPLLDRVTDGAPPPALAHYRLIRELGRGGMGRVWLAERDLGGAVQQVALKQILHQNWNDEDRRRFARERRILASLEHAHIAALVDGGSDATGAPYLATVFVDGERLDRYVAQHVPTLAERVQLIAKIASAVAYAHRRLVVHRDLKPANILVDREGSPKLLDFGVARLLAEAEITTTGPSPMTLRYAAPEQLRGDADESAGAACDIYALGVLLYELVANASPYPQPGNPKALLAAILQHDPSPPSRAPAAVSGANADLDAIVLKALRKRPEERYVSADTFLVDLQRWLRREPVEARRGERGYHTRAWLRRRWPWLAAATAVLAAGVGFATVDSIATRRQLAAVALERDKARAVVHFFDELFASATPGEVDTGTLSARELLRRSAARLNEGVTAKLSDDALAAMYYSVARVMQKQALNAEAAQMYERAIGLWRSLPRPPGEDLVSALHERARIAYIQGQSDAALAGEREAEAILATMPSADASLHPAVLNSLSVMLFTRGDGPGALATLERANALLRAQLPEGRLDYSVNLRSLAMLRLYAGKPDEGLTSAREALAHVESLKPERSADVLSSRTAIAAALRELGRYAESEAEYRATLQRIRSELGDKHPHLADAMNSYAKLLLLQQRWEEAEALLRELQALHTANGGPDHPRALAAKADLALIRIGQQRFVDAERDLADVLDKREKNRGVDQPTLNGERTAHAYAACCATAMPQWHHVELLQTALTAMREQPPLPRARLLEAEAWLVECRRRVTGTH